jgi:putative ABC transport system permease protein
VSPASLSLRTPIHTPAQSREARSPVLLLFAGVGCVLLMACANLAGLLILRSSTRHQEIAVRLSLGAARGRIARQLLTESTLLAVTGGAAGLVLAHWSSDLLLTMMSRGREPIALDVGLNAHSLLFATGVTMLAAILFGLLPAIGASRADVGAVHAYGGTIPCTIAS